MADFRIVKRHGVLFVPQERTGSIWSDIQLNVAGEPYAQFGTLQGARNFIAAGISARVPDVVIEEI